MNLLFTGVTSLQNRGVEALCLSTMMQLQAHFPDCKLHLLSQDPSYDESCLQQAGLTVAIHPRRKTVCRFGVATLDYRLPSPGLSSAIQEADAIIVLGGDIFSTYWRPSFHWHLQPLYLAQQLNKPVIFFGHSIGPFRKTSDQNKWLNIAQYSPYIQARENITAQYLQTTLHLHQVQMFPDPAFLLPTNELPSAKSAPQITLVPSAGISAYSDISEAAHTQAWQRLIDRLLTTTDANLLLIPHVHSHRKRADDCQLAQRLADSCSSERVNIANMQANASTYKGLIGTSNLLITERTHAAIAGYSTCVPTIAIQYSVKAPGIASLCYGDKSLEQSAVIPVETFVSQPDTDNTVLEAWHHRSDYATVLEQRMPRILKDTTTGCHQLAEAIRQSTP